MRIKKIEWDNNQLWPIPKSVKATLPFGYEASIWRQADNSWSWNIIKSGAVLKEGLTITRNGAHIKCEQAWRDIVKEALEPSDLFVIYSGFRIEGVFTNGDEAEASIPKPRTRGIYRRAYVIDLDDNVTEVEYEYQED